MAFFSIATTGLAIRPLFTSNFLIHYFMDMKWVWIVRWEYTGLYLILDGMVLVCCDTLPGKTFQDHNMDNNLDSRYGCSSDAFSSRKNLQLYDLCNLSSADHPDCSLTGKFPSRHSKKEPCRLHLLHNLCISVSCSYS